MIIAEQTVGKIKYQTIDGGYPEHSAPKGTVCISSFNGNFFTNQDGAFDWEEKTTSYYYDNTYHDGSSYTGLAADTSYVLVYGDGYVANGYEHFSESGITFLTANSGLPYLVEHNVYASVNGASQELDGLTNRIYQTYPVFYSDITSVPPVTMEYGEGESLSNTSFFTQATGSLLPNEYFRWGIYSSQAGGWNLQHGNFFSEVLQESVNLVWEDWENTIYSPIYVTNYLDDFSTNNMTMVDDTTNNWVVNSAVSFLGDNSLYVSDDGYNYQYSGISGVSHAYFDVVLWGNSELVFHWKAGGDSENFGVIYLVDSGVTPIAGEYDGNATTTEVSTGWTSTIGTNIGTAGSYNTPFEAYYDYSYQESIFFQSEIDYEGIITGISFYYNGTTDPLSTRPIKIWLYENSKSSYLTTTDWLSTTNMTLVYEGTPSFDSGVWNEFVLQTAFTYTNTNNLILATYMSGSYTASADDFYGWDSGTNRNIILRRDNTDIDTTAPPTAGVIQSTLPNMKLDIWATVGEPNWVTSDSILIDNLYGESNYVKENVSFVGTSGETKRIVFTWVNSTGVTNPPISIDDLEVKAETGIFFDVENWTLVDGEKLIWTQVDSGATSSNYSISGVYDASATTFIYDTTQTGYCYMYKDIYIPNNINKIRSVLYENGLMSTSANYNLWITPNTYTPIADEPITAYTAIPIDKNSDWTRTIYDLDSVVLTGDSRFILGMSVLSGETGGGSGENFTENFDTNDTIVKLETAGFLLDYADATPPAVNQFSFDTTYDRSAPNALRFSSYDYGDPNEYCWLMSPRLYPVSGKTTFSFWYRNYTTGSEVFKVGWTSSTSPTISTTGGADDFTYTANITDASTTYQQYVKTDLPEDTTYVIIYYLGTYDYYLYIDDMVMPPITQASGGTQAESGFIDNLQLYIL